MTQRPAAQPLIVVFALIGLGGLPLPHGERLIGGGVGLLSTARAQIGERPAPRDDRSFLAGNGLMARGLYELAIVEYRAFLKDHPDHESVPDARYALGVALHKTGKHAEAIAEIEAIEGQGAGSGSRGSGKSVGGGERHLVSRWKPWSCAARP